MSPEKLIERRVSTLQKKISNAVNEVTKLREECLHPNKTSVPKSDTGNYCKADDRYWVEHHCPNCGKRWDT
jgi:sugar-specific transcriptional regulator TrmB